MYGASTWPPIPPSARKRPGVAVALLGCVAAVVGWLGAVGTRSHGCRDRPEASTRAFVAPGGRGGVAADVAADHGGCPHRDPGGDGAAGRLPRCAPRASGGDHRGVDPRLVRGDGPARRVADPPDHGPPPHRPTAAGAGAPRNPGLGPRSA